MNDPLPRITQGLNAARNTQCTRHDIDPTTQQHRLLDHVPQNTMELAVELHERWLNPTVVIGAIRFVPGQPQSVEDAFELECMHQWVEVNPDGVDETYVVDIASRTRSDDTNGAPLIAHTQPDGYETLQHGRVLFEHLPSTEPITASLYREYEADDFFETTD